MPYAQGYRMMRLNMGCQQLAVLLRLAVTKRPWRLAKILLDGLLLFEGQFGGAARFAVIA